MSRTDIFGDDRRIYNDLVALVNDPTSRVNDPEINDFLKDEPLAPYLRDLAHDLVADYINVHVDDFIDDERQEVEDQIFAFLVGYYLHKGFELAD